MKKISILLFIIVFTFLACNQNEKEIKGDKTPRNGYFKGVIGITLSEGEFDGGEKQGCWIEYFGDEEVRRVINYDHGKKHGVFIELNREGTIIAQRNYKEGKLDGLSFDFILGKKILHKTYKDGLLHGEVKSFYEDSGRMKDAFVYANGKKNGSAAYYYINGKRMARYKYKEDLLNGEQLTYYDNGKLMSKENFENAIKKGTAEEYNENGKLVSKGNYENDNMVGIWEYYDEEGNVIETKEFVAGKEK